MKVEIGIQANCSEATLRINLTGQKGKNINDLKEKLYLELNQDQHAKDEAHDWDDEEAKKEFDWSEAYINDSMIFGIRVLEIKGDAPYNYNDELAQVVERYLPDAKTEWVES